MNATHISKSSYLIQGLNPARFGAYNNMRQTHSFHFKQLSV